MKLFYLLLYLPLLAAFKVFRNKKIEQDLSVWNEKSKLDLSESLSFITQMRVYKELRNVFYYRLRTHSRLARLTSKILSIVYRPETTLYINCDDIGGGLWIKHGFATIIYAETIGERFACFQQITIGSRKGGIPTIGNNVLVTPGAKVFGKINIGNNVNIGANAVVFYDVPDNATCVGTAARIVKLNNQNVDIELKAK